MTDSHSQTHNGGNKMARMHSRARGKAKPTRPSKRILPSWVRYKEKEVEMLVTKLAKEGKSTSEIGIILRDSYGIPDVRTVAKKTISQILKEKSLEREYPEDIFNLIKRAFVIRKHIEKNRQDKTALRGLQLTESKVKRLGKYYKKTGRLPEDWKYDPKTIRLHV